MSDYDVTGRVKVTEPRAVCAAIKHIFRLRYPHFAEQRLDTLFDDFAQLYRGERPGFHACETGYHDMRHVLDVTLAMARLLDGYEAEQPPHLALGAQLAFVGVSVALYHDAGYIRRRG
ncbi:MAG: hypothetical protein RBS22_04260, partial [Spongiibacteraceae bacterium]|nr:hypothetical protein [Spongiibacteraceae bacterium]